LEIKLPELEIDPERPAPLDEVPEDLQGIIINDCRDTNASARQIARFRSLFGVEPTFIGLGEGRDADLEAGGELIDQLEAVSTPESYPDTPVVALVNVAPRGDDVRQKWENGTPFAYTKIDKATVFAPVEGRVLPLLRKLGLAEQAEQLDIPQVTASFLDQGILTEEEAAKVRDTQFRSLHFLPLAARELIGGNELPSKKISLDEHPGVAGRAWFIDNFGNVKTTLTPEEIGFEEGQTLTLESGQDITCYRRLADVPTDQLGLTIGSSGYGDVRLLEVAKAGGRAADDLNIGIGSTILSQEAATVRL
jgi:hypothetical protein